MTVNVPDSREVSDAAGELVSRDEVVDVSEYVFKWNPYDWARDEGYEGYVIAEVVDVHRITGDITLELADGTGIRDLGEGRSQVMGPADNPNTPDWTDVGTGGVYYHVDR